LAGIVPGSSDWRIRLLSLSTDRLSRRAGAIGTTLSRAAREFGCDGMACDVSDEARVIALVEGCFTVR